MGNRIVAGDSEALIWSPWITLHLESIAPTCTVTFATETVRAMFHSVPLRMIQVVYGVRENLIVSFWSVGVAHRRRSGIRGGGDDALQLPHAQCRGG